MRGKAVSRACLRRAPTCVALEKTSVVPVFPVVVPGNSIAAIEISETTLVFRSASGRVAVVASRYPMVILKHAISALFFLKFGSKSI